MQAAQLPAARVLSRARNRPHAWKLMDLSSEPFGEVLGSRLEVGERVLTALGIPGHVARAHVQRFREHDDNLIRTQHLLYDEAAVIQSSRGA